MSIGVALVDTVPLGVDTPADLARARGRCRPRRGTAVRHPEASSPDQDRRPTLTRPVQPARPARRVSFQGEPGANSHEACRGCFPDYEPRALRHLRGRLRGGEVGRLPSWA